MPGVVQHAGKRAHPDRRERDIPAQGEDRIRFVSLPVTGAASWTGGLLVARNVEEDRQSGRRSEYLSADMGIVGIGIQTEVVETIEQQVHCNPHFHASQVHSHADVRTVAP